MVAGEENQAGLFGKGIGMTAAALEPVNEPFDMSSLDRWMKANIIEYQGPLSVERFPGGQSNPTFKLVTPHQNYVLRRKPAGHLLKGAHAIEREAEVLKALGPKGFPVAQLLGLCTDDAVIGSWFYVMEMVEGRIFWDATFPQVSYDERPLYFDAMNATLASLHGFAPAKIGLANYGKPGNYFERQIARWSRQYVEDADAGRDPIMDRLIEWLPANLPDAPDETTLVHGDFRCDNMIFHPTGPRVIAVLDWELSTLGHPLADFAYHAMMYRMTPDIVAGLAECNIAAMNIPTEADYVSAYCRRTGRSSIPAYDFYVAFNFFRMAAIFHGIKGRVLRGNASSAQAKERVSILPKLIRLAWEQAERAGA